jgi:hypothetical protein
MCIGHRTILMLQHVQHSETLITTGCSDMASNGNQLNLNNMSSLRQLRENFRVLAKGIPAGWTEDMWVDELNNIRNHIRLHSDNQRDTFNHKLMLCPHATLQCILFECVHALPHQHTKGCGDTCETVVSVIM